MKKIILFAAACVALVACNKQENAPADPNAFVKGQEVTIGVSADMASKVASSISGSTVNFTWQAGDKIQVLVGMDATAVFTLTSGAGTSSATFTGTMPAEGNTFSVNYPATGVQAETQTYRAGNMPTEGIAFGASGVSLGSTANLVSTYAGACLNFTSAKGKTVGSIEFAGNLGNATLVMPAGGVQVGSTAVPFYMYVPRGSYPFTVTVKDTEGTTIKTIASSGSINFGDGTGVRNLAAKSLDQDPT